MSVRFRRCEEHIGQRFGDLTLVALSRDASDNNRIIGEFSCSCGGSIKRAFRRVMSGELPGHCGCKTYYGKPKHGMKGSPEYSSWTAMLTRCRNPRSRDFERYGAIGRTVHPAFECFETFYAEVGPRPPGTSLDRIDNTRGYEPGNVRWATKEEQQRNRASACEWHIKGHVFATAQEAADFFGVSEQTVWRWVRGSFDRRRGSFNKPRSDCHAYPRY